MGFSVYRNGAFRGWNGTYEEGAWRTLRGVYVNSQWYLTGPAAPSNLAATNVTSSSLRLTWTDNSTDETGFRVYKDGVEYATVGANTTYCDVTGLAAATQYAFNVAAYNAGGSASSATIYPTTLSSPPAAPTNLSASPTGPTTASLSWTDNSNDETGFTIWSSTDGVSFSDFASVGANSTSHNVSGLTAEVTYYWRVSAYNGAGHSDYSNTDTTTQPMQPPAAPSNLSASANGATQIDLSWTDNSTNESGFEIYRSTNGANFVSHDSVGAGVTSYSDVGLSSGTTYWYKVAAYNAGGSSELSAAASATTLALPAAPTQLSGEAGSATTALLVWTDNSFNETGFSVEYSTNGYAYQEHGTTTGNSYNASGLLGGETYTWRVRAYNAAGYSDYSNTYQITQPLSTPTAPSNLVITDVGATSVSLSWSDNSSNETYFNIYYSTNGGAFSLLNITASPSAVASGLSPNTQYAFYVTAYNSAGESTASNTVSDTTDAVAPSSFSAAQDWGLYPDPATTLSWSNTISDGMTLEWFDYDVLYDWVVIGSLSAGSTSFNHNSGATGSQPRIGQNDYRLKYDTQGVYAEAGCAVTS